MIAVYFRDNRRCVIAASVNYLEGLDVLEVIPVAGGAHYYDVRLVRSVWDDMLKVWPMQQKERAWNDDE